MEDSRKAADALNHLVRAAVLGGIAIGAGILFLGLYSVFNADYGDPVLVGWAQMILGPVMAVVLSREAWKSGKVLRRALEEVQ
jgi:hypothetical protein